MENHQALYRKWRPSTFSEVCGQEHITDVLKYEVENGRVSHAYLFCGSRGTGKTTCAKILAKAVNCLSPVGGDPCGKCEACRAADSGEAVDIVEMDAASNNGVDYIRDIRESVVYTPAQLKNRVYIIDEVHMLSQGAFNALLKTLEEPPSHVLFILATTELQKIPATILSRCQRFEFRRITPDVIKSRLRQIADAEKIGVTDEALSMLARLAQGGMRDAVSLLELCAGGGREITADTVLRTVGVTGRETLAKTVRAVLDRDYETLFSVVSDLYVSSKDIGVFWQDLIGFYRDMLVVRTTKNPEKYLELTEGEMNSLRDVARGFQRERLVWHSRLLDDAFVTMSRGTGSKRLLAEMTLLKLCDDPVSTEPEALAARIAVLEDKLARIGTGMAAPAEVSPKAPAVKPPSAASSDPPETVPEAAPPDLQPAEESSSLRPLPGYIEIIRKIEESDPWLGSVLKISEAQTDGKHVIFTADSDFSAKMLQKQDNIETLVRVLSSEGACGTLTAADIRVQTVRKKTDSNAPNFPDFENTEF